MATIYEVLQREHTEVRTMLEELHDSDASETTSRAALIARVVEQVASHSRAEQEVVYPLLPQAPEGAPAVKEALDEHGGIETALRDLVACDVHDELWAAKLEVVRECFDKHVEHEESHLFALLRKVLDDNGAHQLAEEFERRKSVLTGHAA